MSPLVSLVMDVDLLNWNEACLSFGSVKDHLGVYWKGCMGSFFMSYLGKSYDNFG